MKEILNILFIKDTKINKDLFSTLYYSYDNESFAGLDINILLKNQIYNSYEIIKERYTLITENHNEYKYFVKLNDKINFIRILSDYNNIVYDIMIYDIKDNDSYDKFDKIFFPNIIVLPAELKNINKTILYIDKSHIKLIYNEKLFVSYLGYEDWDYKNKLLNMLDMSIIDEFNILNDFKEKDFIKIYKFKKNNSNIIKLELDIKYKNGFYYINNVKEIK